MNPPTPERPLWINGVACLECEGDAERRMNCTACKGRGVVTITECPRKAVTEDVWRFVKLAQHAKRGLLPVAGGLLNQTAAFMEGLNIFLADDAAAESEATEAAMKMNRED